VAQQIPFILRDARTGQEYPISPGGLRIGRMPQHDVVLSDEKVSRHHATLWVQGDQLYIRDENSTNGTWVNEQCIAGSTLLQTGDRVHIGDTVFEVAIGATPPLAAEMAIPARVALPVVPIAIAGGIVLVILIALILRAGGGLAVLPTATPTLTPTLTPTAVPTTPTASPTPTPTEMPTAIPTHVPLAATPTPVPPATTPTSTPPAPTTPAVTAPPPSGVVATFLADARRTQNDLLEIKVWFDRLAGGERIPCSTVYAHAIHRPSSTTPAQVPDLVSTWNEYQAAIADGQRCLQWLVDFCNAGGGVIDYSTFWDRRALSSSALSHCEHVVQALEGR